ncbi:MAG: hypothetical protein EA404_06855 [Spirochaetaceae bacterium]|nr:MAG: hypothetical protein EA404_06855 [Spirochaetaceae bacterium]
MKLLGFCILLFLTSAGLSAEGDFIRRGLEVSGDPYSVRLYDVNGAAILREEALFNGRARIKDRKSYTEDGAFQLHTRYQRDDRGNLKTVSAYNQAGDSLWRHEYRYQNATLQQEVVYNATGELDYTDLYSYDSDGNLLERARYGPGGLPRWRTQYEHDSVQNRVLWETYYSDGRLLRQGEEQYDQEGRLVREVHRDEIQETYQEVRYAYDQQGRPISERISDSEGSLRSVRRIRYDDFGNIAEETESRFDGRVTRRVLYHYRYDEYGNWIERTITEREKPQFGPVLTTERVHRRTITYKGEG